MRRGWWHYEEAMEDDSHIIAIFDAPTPEVILGSDILRLTPARAMAETYCLDEAKWREAIAPIARTVGIGPLDHCRKSAAAAREAEEASGKTSGRAQQAPNGAHPSSSASAAPLPQTQAALNRAPAPYPPGYPHPPAPGYGGGSAPYAFPPAAYVYPQGCAAAHPNAWPQTQPPHPFPFRPHPQPQPRP